MRNLATPPNIDSMSDDELRSIARSMAGAALVGLLPEFVRELRYAETLEEKRKGLAFLMELSGSKAPAPKEERDNLPLINITIGRNVQVQATAPGGETQTLEFSTDDLSAAMQEMNHVNADLVLDV